MLHSNASIQVIPFLRVSARQDRTVCMPVYAPVLTVPQEKVSGVEPDSYTSADHGH